MTRLLLAGEDSEGTLLRSLLPGLSGVCEVVTVSLENRAPVRSVTGVAERVANRTGVSRHDTRLIEAVRDHQPDVVLVTKGRGLSADGIARARKMGSRVAIYYPDNPLWRSGDSGGALDRLAAADLVLIWSHRLARALEPTVRAVTVVPFGYDHRWFRPAAPDAERSGIVFLGTWSLRRERFLSALAGLPLRVGGTGWLSRGIDGATGPVREQEAGRLLATAAVGINLLHPQNTGAHNMRTREVAACGALELTDPGTDGTPLRDTESCFWFRSPEELRALAEKALADPARVSAIAREGQEAVIGETYDVRAAEIAELLEAIA
ncbi:MAG: glycosyltransferase [Actinomycetota bacterium]